MEAHEHIRSLLETSTEFVQLMFGCDVVETTFDAYRYMVHDTQPIYDAVRLTREHAYGNVGNTALASIADKLHVLPVRFSRNGSPLLAFCNPAWQLAFSVSQRAYFNAALGAARGTVFLKRWYFKLTNTDEDLKFDYELESRWQRSHLLQLMREE